MNDTDPQRRLPIDDLPDVAEALRVLGLVRKHGGCFYFEPGGDDAAAAYQLHAAGHAVIVHTPRGGWTLTSGFTANEVIFLEHLWAVGECRLELDSDATDITDAHRLTPHEALAAACGLERRGLISIEGQSPHFQIWLCSRPTIGGSNA